ncbi:MAG: flagellar filament capping protein FliD, partial [Acidimicrobiia bacterium]
MANASIDGLVSGLDTTALVTQLMQLERQPQVRLVQHRSAQEAAVAAYRSINTRLEALQTAAAGLTGPDGWERRTVTTGSDAVSATVEPGAPLGTIAFDVVQVAAAHTVVHATAVASPDTQVTDGPTFTVTPDGGDPIELDAGNGSLAAVAAAVNAADAGVRAAVVQAGPGQYRLQLTSAATGAASGFALDGLTVGGTSVLGPPLTLTEGRDAVLVVGAGSPGEYAITSPSNTVSALPGVTLTLHRPATGVGVDVRADDAALADGVAALVDAANLVLDDIARLTAYDVTARAGGPLVGDRTVRALQEEVLRQVSGATDLTLAGAGIEVDRRGRLTFDRAAFLERVAEDPAAAAASVRDGLAPRLADVARGALDSLTGSITTAIEGRKARITDLGRQIEAWDQRLALREA